MLEDHLTLLRRLEYITIQQVVDLLVVQLQERYINSDTPILSHLRQAFHELSCASLYQSYLIGHHSLFNLRFKLAFSVLDILVTLHCVCLACTCLSIGEQSGMVPVHNLRDHAFDAYLLVERSLVGLSITDFVELESFGFFIPGIIPQTDAVTVAVDLHLA